MSISQAGITSPRCVWSMWRLARQGGAQAPSTAPARHVSPWLLSAGMIWRCSPQVESARRRLIKAHLRGHHGGSGLCAAVIQVPDCCGGLGHRLDSSPLQLALHHSLAASPCSRGATWKWWLGHCGGLAASPERAPPPAAWGLLRSLTGMASREATRVGWQLWAVPLPTPSPAGWGSTTAQ